MFFGIKDESLPKFQQTQKFSPQLEFSHEKSEIMGKVASEVLRGRGHDLRIRRSCRAASEGLSGFFPPTVNSCSPISDKSTSQLLGKWILLSKLLT